VMVRMMAEYQLGGELDDEQVAKIVNWLEALR
jgi:cytochrome c peroxidase